LARVEAIYFPAMALLIGLSNLLTIAIGGWYLIHHQYNVTAGTITEFVIYINMLTFPVSAIGWTASMIQRAAASQKRLNEFLQTTPEIKDTAGISATKLSGDIVFDTVTFTYPHTGITALQNFNLTVKEGEKILLLGRTGSGKSTIAQLLLHFYNPTKGTISIGGKDIQSISLKQLREQISYVPQDVFLFSDSVEHNISFGLHGDTPHEKVEQAASFASVHKEILGFEKQYETMIGERGVTLSGGGGGLESKDLGDAIVKRIYTKAINSLQQPVDYSVMTPVGETAARATTMGFGSNSKLTLSDILQQKFSKYNFTSYISTPTDIPSITNATDVLSIDYTLNNQAKAVSFGTQTSNAVYDHTKAICDRLKGSVLTGMQNVVVNNMNMIAYTLKDADGSTEYAMSFVIGAKTGRNNYTLQSNWLNQDYTADETMYNIQLWAVSPTMVTDMATEIISNLQSNMPVQYISAKKLPDTYITSGSRDKTDLVLSVTNNQTNGNGYFVVEDKSNELSTTTTK